MQWAYSIDFDWTAAVASFGMILRNSRFKGQSNYKLVLELAEGSRGDDTSQRRREFIEMVHAAKRIGSR